MQDVIHIIGHKNPDTDSIVAALAYAEFKRKQGYNAIACRIGEINAETSFVLEKFQMVEPVFIQNAKIKLYDLEFDQPTLIKADDTIKEAWKKIEKTKARTLYIVDDEERLVGLVSISDISNILMRNSKANEHLMNKTPIDNIRKVTNSTYMHKTKHTKTNGNVFVLVAGKNRYDTLAFKNSIVIVGDDIDLQQKAIQHGAACMIVVDDLEISEAVLMMAKEANTTILRTKKDVFYVARNIYKAPKVGLLMHQKIISFNNHAYIDDVYTQMSKSRYRSYPVVNNQNKVLGSISRYHLLNAKKRKFILVDHNELSQSIDHIRDADILEIIDHHRIGDIETKSPARFRNETVGSSNTIIGMMYQEHQMLPDKKIAALMCCAIISDTMNFKSPTTTLIDKEIADWLAGIAGIDLSQIAIEMFSAVATLKNKTSSEILYNDFKEYHIDGKRIAIGQINVVKESEVYEIEKDFKDYMEKINTINRFDLMLMCFTDVEGKGSYLVFIGELVWAVEAAFQGKKKKNIYFVESIVSRKKQIIPALSEALED